MFTLAMLEEAIRKAAKAPARPPIRLVHPKAYDGALAYRADRHPGRTGPLTLQEYDEWLWDNWLKM